MASKALVFTPNGPMTGIIRYIGRYNGSMLPWEKPGSYQDQKL